VCVEARRREGGGRAGEVRTTKTRTKCASERAKVQDSRSRQVGEVREEGGKGKGES